MKKVALTFAAVSALAFGGQAFAGQVAQVQDPSAGNGDYFSGDYTYSCTDPATGQQTTCTGHQTGAVTIYDDGVTACNGHDRTSDTGPAEQSLQGYIWVGASHKAAVPVDSPAGPSQSPDGSVGAGHGDPAQGQSPCPTEAG